jgi:hypothetical protein
MHGFAVVKRIHSRQQTLDDFLEHGLDIGLDKDRRATARYMVKDFSERVPLIASDSLYRPEPRA